jgi:hypothetical protein
MPVVNAPQKAKTVRPDAFIEEKLALAIRRIRLYDLCAALLVFLAAALLFLVVLAVCHRLLPLPRFLRWLILAAGAAGAGAYLWLAVVRPLRRPINLAYAALQVERLMPEAKNSVVNYVELREQRVPAALRLALGIRAARDLARAPEPQKAISPRRLIVTGIVAGAALVAFLIAVPALGFGRFFAPFDLIGDRGKVSLTVLRPEGGDAVLSAGQGLGIAVRVEGPVPTSGADAPTLLFRYQDDDPDQSRALKLVGGEWLVTLSDAEVRDGFSYRVRAAGVETPTHRVCVRAAPAITDLRATYHFRPYLALLDETHILRSDRKIEVLRGTEVLLDVRTNRDVKSGRIDLESGAGKHSIQGERGADPHSLLVRFTAGESGVYRLRFETVEGEQYQDAAGSTLTVLPDEPPYEVVLSRPGEDRTIPADGQLDLEGYARDREGVRSLTLKMRVKKEGQQDWKELRPQAYRPGVNLALPGGGYPQQLDYTGRIDGGSLYDSAGQSFVPAANTVLEYWLEADDACDLPRPKEKSVGVSKPYTITFQAAENPSILERWRNLKLAAERDKIRHDQQAQKIKDEDKARQDEIKREQARLQEEERKANGEQPGQADPDTKQADAAQREKERQKAEELVREEAQRFQDAIDKQRQANQEGGQGKGDNRPGENKPEPGGKEGSGQQGENKSGDPNTQQGGESKEGGQQGGMEQSAAGKEGQGDPGMGQGEGKGGEPGGQSGQSKGDGSEKSQNAESKSGGPQQGGDAKPAGQGPGQGGESKGGSEDSAKGEAKQMTDQPGQGGARSESKGGEGGKGEGKKGDGAQGARGENKSSGGEGQPGMGDGRAEAKTETPHSFVPPRDAGVADVQRLLKEARSDSPSRRSQARQDLERISNEARDGQAADAAGQALDELAKDDVVGAVKPGGSGDPRGSGQGEGKAGAGGQQGRSGEAKSGDGGAGPGKGGENKGGAGGGSVAGESKGAPTAAQQGVARNGGGPDQRGQQPRPSDRKWGPTMAQLRAFKETVDPNILKDAGLSEEARQQLLKNYAQALPPQQRRLNPDNPTEPRTARQGSDAGTNREPGATGNETITVDRLQAPPGYRKAWDRFSSRLPKRGD